MAKINPEKEDLVSGYSAPSEVFRSMGLKKGDIFENKKGITLKVEPTAFSDKLQVQAMEETGLEQKTERILTGQLGFEEGVDFKKQFYPAEIQKNYSIDFAFPMLRLAIEPHGSHLWELNDGDETEKEQNLNQSGWDVIWFDEDDLENLEVVAEELREQMNTIIDEMYFVEETRHKEGCKILKSLPNTRQIFRFNSQEAIEEASLSGARPGTVVYEGRIFPSSIAEIRRKTRQR
jgi:very-short-patch-repair endonuclease